MSHHARTLTAVVAALIATLAVAANAGAHSSVVRVETRDMNSIAKGAFFPRTATETTGPATIADSTTPATTANCAADSPIAAITRALGGQVTVVKDTATGRWLLDKLKGVGPTITTTTAPYPKPAWYWRVYVDQASLDDEGGWDAGTYDICTKQVPPGSEVLVYQACGTITGNSTQCYSGTPLYMRIRDGGPYDITPQLVPGRGAPVAVKVFGGPPIGAPAAALLGTDEASFTPYEVLNTGPLQGQGMYSFTAYGPHQVIAVDKNGTRPPARMDVCVTEGNDGNCGTTKVLPPPEIPYEPSPCTTNGHDGFCGTTDTSGPVTHVTNITQKKVFKAKKGPGQVKGTIEVDPNGVGDVKLRLTRAVSTKVKVKVKTKRKKGSKKKPKTRYRYKTVKRCSAWSDAKALLVTTRKCGTKYGTWWTADLSDLRNEFSYSFAMTLPRGTYVLEVMATDEDGHKDVPTNGRNVLTFTVK
jgi:hypothetical protein